jgi:hypothetical protein
MNKPLGEATPPLLADTPIIEGAILELPAMPEFLTWSHAYIYARGLLAIPEPQEGFVENPHEAALLRHCVATIEEALNTEGRIGYEHVPVAKGLIIDVRERLGDITTEEATALRVGASLLSSKPRRLFRR